MKDFNSLPVERQVQAIQKLAASALQRYEVSGNSEINLLAHRENTVFRVDDTRSGQRFVLRVHRPGYHSDDAIRSELAWMIALDEAGVPTPEVIAAKSGDLIQTVEHEEVPGPRQCDLLGWVDGSQPDPGNIVAAYRILGELNARIHKHAAEWNPPGFFERHAWDEDGMLGQDPLWGRFWELEKLTEGQVELFHEVRDAARARLVEFGKDADRYGLIHADLMPDNILISHGNVRVIDFDDSGFGWNLYDLATALFLHYGNDYYDAITRSWVDGYRSVYELPDEHLKMLPTLLVARGLVALGWVHTRRETDLARLMTDALINGMCRMAEGYLGTI
jgi:Ser/Thr protein kinase RdoA (MazF antagonist)